MEVISFPPDQVEQWWPVQTMRSSSVQPKIKDCNGKEWIRIIWIFFTFLLLVVPLVDGEWGWPNGVGWRTGIEWGVRERQWFTLYYPLPAGAGWAGGETEDGLHGGKTSQILSYHQLEELSGCWHSWKDCCRLIPGHPVGSQQPIKEFHMHFLVHFILHPMLRGEGVSRAGSTGDTGSGLFSFTCFLFVFLKGISVPKGEWK